MKSTLLWSMFVLQSVFFSKVIAQEPFVITGSVPEEYNGADIILKAQSNPSFAEIHTTVKNQKFILKGYTTQKYERVSISVNRGYESSKGTAFFIGTNKMEVRFDSFSPERSNDKIRYINIPLIEDEQNYLQATCLLNDSVGKAFNFWQRAGKDIPTKYNLDSLHIIYQSLRKRNLLNKIDWIKQNPHSYISIYYFREDLLHPSISSMIQPDSLLSVYKALSIDLRNTALGKASFETIKKRQSLLLNSEMPVFSFKTNKGEEFSLSSFRGQKYVLICFWASWCGPCIKNIPTLQKISEEYSPKELQVISISIDDDSKNWLKALNKYSMQWLQSCDLPAYTSGTTIRSLYNIQLIPQYFLVDKSGKLIYQDIQFKDDDGHSRLKKILHEQLGSQVGNDNQWRF